MGFVIAVLVVVLTFSVLRPDAKKNELHDRMFVENARKTNAALELKIINRYYSEEKMDNKDAFDAMIKELTSLGYVPAISFEDYGFKANYNGVFLKRHRDPNEHDSDVVKRRKANIKAKWLYLNPDKTSADYIENYDEIYTDMPTTYSQYLKELNKPIWEHLYAPGTLVMIDGLAETWEILGYDFKKNIYYIRDTLTGTDIIAMPGAVRKIR